jgi:hypothetical protein
MVTIATSTNNNFIVFIFYILSMIETAGRDAARAYQNYESVNWNELISVSIVDTACGRRNASH